jgi:predicted alpha/beta-hydrolase family hydrolase
MAEAFADGATSGFLHRASSPINKGLVLTHGAGANCQSALLVATASAFAEAGFHVLRFDLPFRQRRRFGPPHPTLAADDRNGLRAAVLSLRSVVSGPIFLGGHSYGGRQASILASEDPAVTEGLLLLSYPLHPPKKLAQPRTAHFPRMRTPALFVHGTGDPFGTVAELREALQLIPASTILSIVEGATHDLNGGKFDIRALAVERFAELA